MTTIYRFMGNVEHALLCQGRTIENHTHHGELRGDASTSAGFCFGFGDEKDAVHQSRFLKGIVTMQWLMVAEVCDVHREAAMHIGKGRYVTGYDRQGNPTGYGYFKELCCETMNLGDFDNVRFYLLRGISLKPTKTRMPLTVLYGQQVVSRKEQWLLKFSNGIAHSEADKISYFKYGEDCRDTTGDFTRVPLPDAEIASNPVEP